MEGSVPENKIQNKHHLALVGLKILDLQLTASMRLPLGPNTINQGAREEISGDGNGEISGWVLQLFFSSIIAVGLLILVLPVLLLLKNLVPRGECILAQMGEVGWDIIFRHNNLGLLSREVLQGDETKVWVKVCVCFWPPVLKWGPVKHEIPISSPPLNDIPSIP